MTIQNLKVVQGFMEDAYKDQQTIADALRRNAVIGTLATLLIVALGVTLAYIFKTPWLFAGCAPAVGSMMWTAYSAYHEGKVRHDAPYYDYLERLQEVPVGGDQRFDYAMQLVRECYDLAIVQRGDFGQPFPEASTKPVLAAIEALQIFKKSTE